MIVRWSYAIRANSQRVGVETGPTLRNSRHSVCRVEQASQGWARQPSDRTAWFLGPRLCSGTRGKGRQVQPAPTSYETAPKAGMIVLSASWTDPWTRACGPMRQLRPMAAGPVIDGEGIDNRLGAELGARDRCRSSPGRQSSRLRAIRACCVCCWIDRSTSASWARVLTPDRLVEVEAGRRDDRLPASLSTAGQSVR